MARPKTPPRIGPAPEPPWRRPPALWAGTLPEYAVYWALLQEFGPTSAGVLWFYQTPFAGGRMFAGGAVVDFWIPSLSLAIRVQGEFWHGHAGGDKRASDLIQRLELEAGGATVVDISDTAALASPRAAVKAALAGRSTGMGAG